MTWTMRGRTPLGFVIPAASVVTLEILASCEALDVSDPTLLEDEDLNNSTGAMLMRKDALFKLASATNAGALTSGMIADEFLFDPNSTSTSPSVHAEAALDRRASRLYEE